MTPEQKLQHAIDTASNTGWGSTMEDLEIAEDEAYMISRHAEELQDKLLDNIYAAMEVRKYG